MLSLAGIVIRRATEDFVSDLLLMDLFGKAFEHAVAKISKSRSLAEC